MKTINTATAAVVSGAQETARLNIEANAKAFKELISGIYSDKTYAICRELMANAVDAHVMKGNIDTPFELHLPTPMDPEFRIRDFGISMDHQTVMTLYRTLFRSSKDDPNNDDSNKFVGKFGLGSKSPFAYTDAFQLTTYLGGIQRVYDIYFNAGAPMISLFMEVEMEEEDEGGIQPDGVMITFAVNAKDCEDFARAAARALEGIDVLPKMVGRHVDPPKRTIQYQGNGWRLYNETSSGIAEARQGTVLYPLRFESIPDCPVHLKPLCKAPFRIEYAIGQLDVTTSREALSFDEMTTANVIKRLEEVLVEVRTMLVSELEKHTNYHKWCAAYYALENKFPKAVWDIILQAPPKFKNRYAPSPFVKVNMEDAKVRSYITDKLNPDAKPQLFINRAKRFGTLQHMVIGRYNSYASIGRKSSDTFFGWKDGFETISLPINPKVIFMLHDVSEGAPRVVYSAERAKVAWNKYSANNTFIIWLKYNGEADRKAITRLLGYLGRPDHEFVNILDFAIPESVKQARLQADDFKVWKRDGWNSPATDLDSLASAGGTPYYIVTRRGSPDVKEWGGASSSDIIQLFDIMRGAGAVDKKDFIIGVPISALSKMKTGYGDSVVPFSSVIGDFAKKLYSRDDAILDAVSLECDINFWRMRNYRSDKSNRSNTRPFTYDVLRKLETHAIPHFAALAVSNPSEKKFARARGTTDPLYGVEFQKFLEGTALEECYFYYRMRKLTNPHNNTLKRWAFNNDKELIAKENAEIAKEKSKLQHQLNQLGGKAIREMPGLLYFAEGGDFSQGFNLRGIIREIESTRA